MNDLQFLLNSNQVHIKTGNMFKQIDAKLNQNDLLPLIYINILFVIKQNNNNLTIKKLRETFSFSKPYTSTLLKSLLNKDLINLQIKENDRRLKFLSLTSKGKKLLSKFERFVLTQFKEIDNLFSKTEVQLLKESIKAIQTVINS